MRTRDKYKTNSKELILKVIENYNGSFSANDIYKKIVSNNEHIGLTTVYRFLDELVSSNRLRKFFNENNTAFYQYLEECDHDNHFYLKCTNCNKIIHIDCDCISDLTNHLVNDHNFLLDRNIFMEGLCINCRGEK